uniref:Uncharacterized protein n=1 Tax=Arundo donax TaxID=35708 RepID=A0A0A9TT96_ARUDO
MERDGDGRDLMGRRAGGRRERK